MESGRKTTQSLNKLRRVAGVKDIEGVSSVSTVSGTNVNKIQETTFVIAKQTQAVANAALSFGKKIGDFPLGKIIVHKVDFDIDYELSVAGTITPEVGLGTVVGSGANATIGAVGATSEDIVDGFNGTQTNGTTSVNTIGTKNGELDQKDGSATAKDLYLNFAADWSGVTGNFLYSGEITVYWSNLDD